MGLSAASVVGLGLGLGLALDHLQYTATLPAGQFHSINPEIRCHIRRMLRTLALPLPSQGLPSLQRPPHHLVT